MHTAALEEAGLLCVNWRTNGEQDEVPRREE